MLRLPTIVLCVLLLAGCGGARTAGPVQVEGRLSAAQGERRALTPAELAGRVAEMENQRLVVDGK